MSATPSPLWWPRRWRRRAMPREAVVLDIDPLPAVTNAEEAAQARRAAALRSHPEQCGAGLSLWRHRQGRGRLRQRRACDQTRHRQHPRRRGGDGAARGARPPTTRRASATRFRFRPRASPATGRSRQEPAQGAEREGSHPDRQCRRLVRHEEHQLSRIYLHPARREGAGPSGEMDRRAIDQLPVRQPGPRAADPLRAGARRAKAGSSRSSVSGYGNLGAYITGVAPGPAVAQHRQESGQRLSHAADERRHQDRVDQHHADGRLSRRRTARGQLFHGAPDRSRRR